MHSGDSHLFWIDGHNDVPRQELARGYYRCADRRELLKHYSHDAISWDYLGRIVLVREGRDPCPNPGTSDKEFK